MDELEKYIDDRARSGYQAYCECIAHYQPTDPGNPDLDWENVDPLVKLALKAFAERVVRYA